MGSMNYVPIGVLNGMWSSGDISLVPDGYCRTARNLVIRPNRLETRPPFVYDSLMTIRGLAVYDDQTNKAQRLLAVNSSPNLFMKGTSGETWSASVGSVGGTRFVSGASYRNKVYGLMDNGSGTPSSAFSFDGTNIDTTPFNSPVYGRAIIPFLDRLFIIGGRIEVTSLINAAHRFYGNASGSTIFTITSGSTSTKRVFTQSPGFYEITPSSGVSLTSATHSGQRLVLRADVQPIDGLYDMPLALIALVGGAASRATAFAAGDVVTAQATDALFYIYRCTTAGTSAAGAVSFNPTGTTADGTVTWTSEGRNEIARLNFTLPAATENQEWLAYYLDINIPIFPATSSLLLSCYLQVGNTDTPTPANYAAFNVAYKDGLADGDVLKRNYGVQLTLGDFRAPFVNKESSDTNTFDLDSVIWSDVLQPKSIRAASTYELPQVAGYPTTGALIGGRLVVFKRGSFWVFNGNQDVTSLVAIPIRSEREYRSVGCIGQKAHDSFEDDLYFIGENGIYRFNVGMDDPEEIGGDAMREEIMERGSNWVESQATYNMPLLRINKRDKEVWVYTQKSKIYVYNIARKGWTYFDVADNAEIADMMFNPNTQKMYVAVGGFGLARVDWSSAAANDTVDNTANTYTCTKDLVARPLEAFSPRQDWLLNRIGVYHTATATQTSQTVTAYYSLDRGSTYSNRGGLTLNINNPKNPFSIYKMGPSITVKLSHVGKAGPSIWGVSKLEAEIISNGIEWSQVLPS